ncbi:MAG: lipoprotein insertase outer membrane protein LolB, partial [Lysobacterales bacterium]
AAGAAIQLADGSRSFAPDPEQFLAEMTGVNLPVAALPYWMQAVPIPTRPFRAEAEAVGRPTAIWQGGWQIQYTAYAIESATANPTRLELKMGDIDVRLVISDWSPR